MSKLIYSTNGTITIIEEKPLEAFSKIANYDNNNNNCYFDTNNKLLPNKINDVTNERSCINKASQQYNTIGYQTNEKMCWGANYTTDDIDNQYYQEYQEFVNKDMNKKDCNLPNSISIYQYNEPENTRKVSKEEEDKMEQEYNRRLKNYDDLKKSNFNNYNQQQQQPKHNSNKIIKNDCVLL